ncbi:hypothetical protein [Cobetia crustatorum]|uniref:hypothetical protein n=1 Tax=Cobetia crustatorum TaxID=553385 RepID=UPI0011A752F5
MLNKVNVLRNAALKLEGIDVKLSLSLMEMALIERPNGPYIKSKINFYRKQLAQEESSYSQLHELIASGRLAVVPIGFRCFTKISLREDFGIDQPSLPFDSGFFSPQSVINILQEGRVNLRYDGETINHAVCIKTEGTGQEGNFISFEESSYDFINEKVKNHEALKNNKYLDTSRGYYTLDKDHGYVLAHYNWHSLASHERSKGIVDPEVNLKNINDILNKRLNRMNDLCHQAEQVLFVYCNTQDFSYLEIGDDRFNLEDMERLSIFLREKYGDKCVVQSINSPHQLKDILMQFVACNDIS